MKKEGRLFLIIVLILALWAAVFVQAYSSEVEDAYSCLREKVADCSDLSVEQQAFSLLALSYNSSLQKKCKDALMDNKDSNNCWPKGSCTLKDTSLAILALSELGVDTEDAENWTLSKKIISKELIWYLQIDAESAVSCTITYNDKDYVINIDEDKKIDKSAGNCLSLSEGDYWLKIDNTLGSDCYEKTFIISCDRYFSSTLLYKKQDSSTIFVSSDTKSAPADARVEHFVKSYCLGSGNCDYGGSLWAVSVLAKNSRKFSVFLPYLMAFSEDNEPFLPSAFLYMITGYSQYLTELIGEKTVSGDYVFWKTSDDKFYDTALALYALQDTSSGDANKAKSYLILDGIQDNEGCWRSIRDTAFILHAAWPKPPFTPPEPECRKNNDCPTGDICINGNCVPECPPSCSGKECGDDGCGGSCGDCIADLGEGYWCNNNRCINDIADCVNECTSGQKSCFGTYLKTCGNYNTDGCLEWGTGVNCARGCDNLTKRCIEQTTPGAEDYCEDAGYYCTSPLNCEDDDNLDYTGLICPGIKVCCLSEPSEKTCSDRGGIICSTNQECTLSEVSAFDTSKCCLESCIEKSEEETACEKADYSCRFNCYEDEEEKSLFCDSGKKCCGDKIKEEKSYLWIWLLIILIILVVLAIIFRNQLKMWTFRIKSKFRRGPAPRRTGPEFFPPGRMMPGARPRMLIPRNMPQRPSPRPSPKDKELDETLKKLKQMGR